MILVWCWLDTTYACGGVAVDRQGIVARAAPIYGRFMGWRLSRVIDYLEAQRRLLGWKVLAGGSYE